MLRFSPTLWLRKYNKKFQISDKREIHDLLFDMDLLIYYVVGKPIPEGLVKRKTIQPHPANVSAAVTTRCHTFTSSTSWNEDKSNRVPLLSAFMGAVSSKEDEMMLFDVANLLEDPDPSQFPLGSPSFFRGDEPPVDATLLDKTSADLCNMHILNTPDFQRTERKWFEFPNFALDSHTSLRLLRLIPRIGRGDKGQDRGRRTQSQNGS